MLQAVGGFIMRILLAFGWAKVQEWWLRRKAERARHRAEQLEAYLKGKQAAEKEEAEHIKADKKLKEAQDSVKTYEDKLAALIGETK
jgi:Flp pilus assembly protein TadB